jgi:thiamine-phosphate pyrophosphorylase
MQLCAITDRRLAGEPLVRLVERWSSGGVDFVQLREKDLDLESLCGVVTDLMAVMRGTDTKLLVNVPDTVSASLALEAGAHGVHLAGKPVPGVARSVRALNAEALVSLPCHTLEDVAVAAEERVDLILFSPVFEKVGGIPQGLDGLRRACEAASGIPVMALGGVTAVNARDCVAAGAAGVAAIRLFLGDDWRGLRR